MSVSVLFPLVVSQMRAVPSPDPVRTCVPLGDHTAASITLVVVSVSVLSPVVASQMETAPPDPVTTRVPSGDHSAATIQPPCLCVRVSVLFPVVASQM